MNSHEYAKQLQASVDHILSRPAFELEHSQPHIILSFYEKEKFVNAAKALGSGKKSFHDRDLHYEPIGTCVVLMIGRDKVCRKIQDVKWECEPLLTGEEVEQLGQEEHESVF